jgi:hypothetical protein
MHAPRLASGAPAASVKSAGGGGYGGANGAGDGYSDAAAYTAHGGYGDDAGLAAHGSSYGAGHIAPAALAGAAAPAGAAAAAAGGLAAAGGQPAALSNGGGGSGDSGHWSVHAPQYEAWAGSAEEGLLAAQQAPPTRFSGHLPGVAQ